MLFATRLFDGDRVLSDCRLTLADGRVRSVTPDSRPEAGDTILDGGLLAPGLVDVQINGYAGVDFAAGSEADIRCSCVRLAEVGTTSCLPTIITATVDEQMASLDRLAAAQSTADPLASRILGVHVEGPFISEHRKGAHRAELMIDPAPEVIQRYVDRSVVRLMTLAPERAGAMAAIEQLVAGGVVVSVGHTDATAAQVHEAAERGATMITHLFNAQRPFGHREPGVPGAALVDGRLSLGVIADLHHVAADVLRLVFAAASHRVVLVTDALASTGMPTGTYELGGESIVVAEPGEPARRLDGTMAGSGLSLADAVRNCVSLGIPVDAALRAATSNPVRVVGRSDVGVIVAGAHADLVWLDDDLAVQRTWLGGALVDSAT